MSTRPITLIHLCGLFSLGLCLRITYYFLAVGNLGFDKFWRCAPDTSVYWGAATQIVAGQSPKMCEMLWVGPGYILTLAGLQSLLGANPIYPIVLNILAGSLAPVFVYLIAWHLTNTRAVALMAGLISATSLTSVALSCIILTDQLAFTIFAACLAAYTFALRSASVRWFVIAAIMGSLSAFIRSAAQYWIFIFLALPLLIPVSAAFKTRVRMFVLAGSTGIIMLLVVLGWSYHNYLSHDTFSFATSGTLVARSCLIPQVIAAHTPGAKIIALRTQVEQEDGHATDSCYLEYGKARLRISNMFREHPDWMIGAILTNIHDNIRASNDILYNQIVQIRTFSQLINKAMNKWLGYLIAAISMTGLVFLMIDRNRTAWALLGAGYLFFTAVTGFSYWQGSRLHYQAEMTWSILFAYAIYRLFVRQRTTS